MGRTELPPKKLLCWPHDRNREWQDSLVVNCSCAVKDSDGVAPFLRRHRMWNDEHGPNGPIGFDGAIALEHVSVTESDRSRPGQKLEVDVGGDWNRCPEVKYVVDRPITTVLLLSSQLYYCYFYFDFYLLLCHHQW